MTVSPEDWTIQVRALVAERPGALAGPVDRDRCWDYIRMVRDSWYEAFKRVERALILMILLFAFFELIRNAQVTGLELLGAELENPNILARGVAVAFVALWASVARAYVSIEIFRYLARYLQVLMKLPGRSAMRLIHLNPTSSMLYVNYQPGLPVEPTTYLRRFLAAAKADPIGTCGAAIQAVGIGLIVIVGPASAAIYMAWRLWPDRGNADPWLYLTYAIMGLLFLVAAKDLYISYQQRPWLHRLQALLKH